MTAEAIPCCCGGVDCCPFSSVVWAASTTTFRFTDQVNGVGTIGRYRTVNSSNQPAALQLASTVTAAQVLTRRVSSGSGIPFCIYNKFQANYGLALGWTTTSPFLNSSRIQLRTGNTGFDALDFATSSRYQLAWFVETYNLGGTVPGWEAGVQIAIEFNATTFASLYVGARSSIVANGCPNGLQYISFAGGSQHQGRGTVRAFSGAGFAANINSRIGPNGEGQQAVFADTQFVPTIT
jgi:hypothetical protein